MSRDPFPDRHEIDRLERAARESFGFEPLPDSDPSMSWPLALAALVVTFALCGLILLALDAALRAGGA